MCTSFTRRRGTIYVAVVSLSLLLITLAVGTLLAVRARGRDVEMRNEVAEARLYARSGLEVGRLWVDQDPSWRSNRINGTWATDRAIGRGTFSLEGVNPNGPLAANELDPLILTATGRRGHARQKIRATLTAVQTPYTCLSATVAASASVSLQGATITGSGTTIASNGSIIASNCTVNPNVDAVGTISGGTYLGSIRAGSRALTMPRPNVFDHYIANGTAIARSALPGGSLSAVLLSPSSNPFGAQTNLRGIYVVDCQNQTVNISNCRIVGTLVLLDPGPGSSLQGSVNWAPAVERFPTLLVRGDIVFRPSTTGLSESSVGVNFNPSGAPYPYPAGASDTSMDDSYPSHVGGMIYVSGSASFNTSATIGMLICGGTVSVTSSVSTLALNFDAGYAAMPPPGFSSIRMVLSEGSYVQVVDP